MAPLELTLLGAPRLTLAGQTVKLPRRQPLALLAYLALAGGAVARDRLAFLLWADAPQALARRRLRRTLGQLRETLTQAGCGAPLEAEGETVRLNTSACRVDALEFARLARAALAAGSSEAAEAGECALSVYAGPLLEGLALDDAPELEQWLSAQREHYQHLHWQLLAHLAHAHFAGQRLPRAIALAEVLAQADPLREDAHRLLMRLYAAAGQRARALQQFELCAITLERELGVLPLPETRALYATLLQGPPTGAPAPTDPPPAPATWPTHRTLAVPLIGRTRELASLRQVLAQALAGRPAVACVSGPAGIGKSRLIQSAAEALGRPVWLSGGQPGGQVIPYAAVLPALRVAVAAHLPAATLPDLWLAEASRVLPELRLQRPGLHPPAGLPHEQAQARLFEALTRLVVDLAGASGGALLVLDNLEEADAPSLAWLANLAAHLEGVPLAVVVALRDETDPALATWLAGLERRGLRHSLRPGPWQREDLAQLVQEGFGLSAEAGETLSARLHAETGGVPLFALETLRMLQASGEDLASAARADWPLPESVYAVLAARFQHLSPIERQVADAAAVLGQAFTEAEVRAVAGRDEAETALALDQLAERQLLGEAAGGYRFAHAQIVEAAYRQVGGARRRLLHRRAAAALRTHGDAPAALVAHHLEGAGETEPAAQAWLEAAQASWAAFAAEPAQAALMRGLALPASPLARFALLRQREEIAHQLGQRALQADCLEQLAALAPALGPAQAALAHERRGRYCLALSRWEEAEAALQAALGAADPEDESALRLLALALAGQQRWPAAFEAAEAALARARGRKPAGDTGEALATLAQLARRREDWAACEAYALEGLAQPDLSPATQRRLTGDLAEARFWRGHYLPALAVAEAIIAETHAQGDRHGEAVGHNLAGRCLTRLQRNAEALAAYGRARDLFAQIEHLSGQASATGNMGTLALRLGDLEHACALHQRAYQLFQQIGEARGMCIAANNVGAALIWLGRAAEAEPLLRASLARARAASLPVQEAVTLGCLGAALLAVDQVDEGVAFMAEGLAQRRALHHLDTCIDAACLAIGYLRAGQRDRAAALSQEALDELSHAAGGVAHPQRVFFGRAQVLHALGDEAGAAEALAEALRLLEAAAQTLPSEAERERYRRVYVFNHDLLQAAAGVWPALARLS